MMSLIENQTFDAERALYGSDGLIIKNCAFDGPADGESALKESRRILAEPCFFHLRYPFWHDRELTIRDSELTPLCRAALWYSDQLAITGSKLHGIKALRECRHVNIAECDIRSPEFGWSVEDIRMRRCQAEGEYFMLRAAHLDFSEVRMKGKYSFQYIETPSFPTVISIPKTLSGMPKTLPCGTAL